MSDRDDSPERQYDYPPAPSHDFVPAPTFSTSFAIPETSFTFQQTEHAPSPTPDVTYSYYPFLRVGNLANIPPEDVNHLERQGCLRVPTRPVLDEFVQQYFLHVHPLLPMLDEGQFWDTYHSCASTSSRPPPPVSLLVFQAMLFASCNFVSRRALEGLGHATVRAARAALHRRCKLLYDMDTESSPVSIAQAALLLTHWSPPTSSAPRKPNSAWLAIAIQHAKTAEAHHHAALPTRQQGQTPAQARRQNLLKRLWWCCIIRDRIMGLGLRRSLQITRAHFDFDGAATFGFADLAAEASRSRVYDPDTKRCLAEILEQLVELCVVLTDVLILVFPLDDSPGWGRDMRPAERETLRDCKVALRRWYKGATRRFPASGGSAVARPGGRGSEFHHDSVILYTNLMYMYYHSSRVVLSHHEVLHLAITASAPSFSTIPSSDMAIIGENRDELQDASTGVTECLKELINLRLARWLPISAVAVTALPLVLHILDAKLSSTQKKSSQRPMSTQSVAKQHRLNILIEAMKTYQWQYDGVDWVSETIRHIINLAQLDAPVSDPSQATDDDAPISDWTDILASQPSSYLRLALTMDLSLSKGRFPEDADFPVSLRGLFTSGVNPIRVLLEQKRKEAEMLAAAAANASAPTYSAFFPSPGTLQAVDFELGTMHPSLFNLQPGTITALPSDTDTNSPTSGTGSPSVGMTESSASPQKGITGEATSEGIASLAAEVMGGYAMDGVPSGAGDLDGMYGDGSGHDVPGDWMEDVWGNLAAVEDGADRDTALVLLEALREGEAMAC
ncbi:cutinase transcription factor 1 beta [Plectosphaerella plurivora]|uniref:Cutinase transcription factor 1 beta n=1 Tax=Plectosphaerella plurivora TaxID=936078 RepID=A0A9P9A593_9PEZI|nr:cutinase transcription factor 1 beta [Plectosphaerella plurivora]